MRPQKLHNIAKSMNDKAKLATNILDQESLDHIISYINSQKNPDGGFKGRDGRSDLYYSLFGLECLEALGQPIDYSLLESFLLSYFEMEDLDYIHLVCLIRCLNRIPELPEKNHKLDILFQRVSKSRTDDGGYKLSPEDTYTSIYASFLSYLAHNECGIPFPKENLLFENIELSASKDGAFADQPGLRNGTTTVTAAVTILFNQYDKLETSTLSNWLMKQYTTHGGWKASPLAPIPDLLSTGTSLFALQALGIDLTDKKEQTFEFVETVWAENGGFCGHLFEEDPDTEYTFYGLLSLGILGEL